MDALGLVERMRSVALDMKRRRRVRFVGDIARDASALRAGRQFQKMQSNWNGESYFAEVRPIRGAAFLVDPGRTARPCASAFSNIRRE